MKENGRPTKYLPEYDKLILEGDYKGLFLVQIASKLEICESTIYEWAKKHPSFSESLTRARENCISKLVETGFFNLVTDKDIKLNEKTLENFLQVAGFGRRLPELAKEKNEYKALAIIQDAMAYGKIVPSQAEAYSKVIATKLEARKTLEMAGDIESIKEKLGIA